jgi:hypothetical protein
MNLAADKVGAKRELLYNKPASGYVTNLSIILTTWMMMSLAHFFTDAPYVCAG